MRFFSLIACLLLCLSSCRQEEQGAQTGQGATAYADLPYAFSAAEREQLPDYAKVWRAPAGFAGFVARWNEQHADEQPAIRFATEADLPPDLHWQEGLDEPELGSPEAKRGGHLRLALLRSFPPNVLEVGAASNHAIRAYLYDLVDIPLVRLHPGTGRVIAGTARAWAVNAAGDEVFYRLDEAARYSNGEPVRTQDVLTALYLRYSPFSTEVFAQDMYRSKLRQLTFYSDRVFSVRMPRPHPMAAYEAMLPLSCTSFYAEFGPDYTTRYQWRRPPTTGCYTLDPADCVHGRQIKLRAVPNWWARDRRYMRYSCNVETITYIFVNDLIKARELFRLGQIDIFSSRESEDWYENLEIPEVHQGYIQRVHFSNLWPRNAFGIHLNSSSPMLQDREVRLGIQHALHVQSAIDTILRGDFTRLGSYFSGYGQYTNPRLEPRPYDVQLARDHFARAGYTEEGEDGILRRPDGARLSLTISSRNDAFYEKIFAVLRTEAAQCGLELKLEQMDDTLYYTRIREKQVQAGIFSWYLSPPLPDAVPYLHSRYAKLNPSNNITAIDLPELDEQIDLAQNARSEEELIAAHHRIQEIVHEHASWVPGWSTTYWRFAQWAWLKWPDSSCDYNFCPPRYYNPMNSNLFWIDEAEKARLLKARAKGEKGQEKEYIIPLPAQP